MSANISFKISVCLIGLIPYVFTIIFGVKVAFKDPGALPVNIFNYNIQAYTSSYLQYGNKYYVKSGRLLKLKFCRTCLVVRPLGSSHCGICNICVESYDHHCPWVGNCIGRNNYKDFLLFLCFFNIGSIYTLIFNGLQYSQAISCELFLENIYDTSLNCNLISLPKEIGEIMKNKLTFLEQISKLKFCSLALIILCSLVSNILYKIKRDFILSLIFLNFEKDNFYFLGL
jgi:hypothetical protein